MHHIADHHILPRCETSYSGLSFFDPAGVTGLRNPERGFRLESIFGMGTRQVPFQNPSLPKQILGLNYSENWQLLNFAYFDGWGITLSQHYCYLTEYSESMELPREVLSDVERSLAGLRGLGVKSVLRFAYETDIPPRRGPKLEILLSHMEQIRPILQRNIDVIYTLEVGFLGAWGEWHNIKEIAWNDYDAISQVLVKSLDILPPSRMISLRSPRYLQVLLKQPLLKGWAETISPDKAFDGSPRSRIGMHNDGFMVEKDETRCFQGPPQPGTLLFDWMLNDLLYTPSGGEMWWRMEGGKIDGREAILRLHQLHFDTLSIIHSFNLSQKNMENINRWQQETISEDWVKANNLPLSDQYFSGPGGQKIERTVFDYIRDHLGYRFEMRRANWPDQLVRGEKFALDAALVNRGFKGLINQRNAYIVFISSAGNVVHSEKLNCNPRQWLPGTREHRISHETSLSLPTGDYLVGLWLPDESLQLQKDSRYAIRFANRDFFWWQDIERQYGVNIFGRVILMESK